MIVTAITAMTYPDADMDISPGRAAIAKSPSLCYNVLRCTGLSKAVNGKHKPGGCQPRFVLWYCDDSQSQMEVQ